MRIMAERLSVLQECDLSEAQARVYLALLDYPGTTASNIAKAAQLPRNRLYEVLEDLSALQLVDVVLEEPRRYRARPISDFLARAAQDLRKKAERLDSRREYLSAAFAPREQVTTDDQERGTTQVLNGRRAVAHEIERLLSEAQNEIVLAGSVGGSLRLASHLLEAAPQRRNVAVELYVPSSAAGVGGWERYEEAAIAPITWVDADRATIIVVADQEEMLRIHPVPDDERTHVGHDFALLTDNLAIIHDEILGLRSLKRTVAAQSPQPAQSDAATSRNPIA